jgi:hypothetical protein
VEVVIRIGDPTDRGHQEFSAMFSAKPAQTKKAPQSGVPGESASTSTTELSAALGIELDIPAPSAPVRSHWKIALLVVADTPNKFALNGHSSCP